MVIAAAGNDNDNLDVRSRSPICVDLTNNAVIGVASTLEGNKKTSFSNYGKKCIDVSAPGQYLPVTVPNGYGRGKGTSFSAPLVAGIAALIKSKNPTWNIEEIKHAILNSAVSVDNVNSKYVGKLGKGIPDVYTALTAAKPKASYTYKPRKQVKIEKTKVEIEIKEPEVQPIKKPEPIKNERIEKHKATKDPTPIKSEKSTPIQNEQKKTNTSKHTITPLFPDIGKHEYIKSINYLKQNRIVKGYPDGTFKPNKVINRAEFTKIIMNGFEKDVGGSNCFPDVKKQWFAGFVCSAKKLGIIKGYPNGKFHPEKTINIVEALKIVLETSGVKLKAQPGKAWYMPYVNYAAGTDLRFILNKKRFEENVTRGEMAKMIYVLKVM